MSFRVLTRLELLAFITGFALMTFELAAARILAPTVGSSTYVWTSVIGVIIAALSFGYYLGGRVADVRKRTSDVAWLLFATGALIAWTTALYPHILPWLAGMDIDVRLQAVFAATLLFAPASLVLGMISPYLAKLNVTSLQTSGRAVANLSAWNSVGGITGTFLTGFFLFSYVGSRDIFIILVVLLLISTILLKTRWRSKQWWLAGISLYVVMFAPASSQAISIDTPSSNYSVFEWQRDGATYRGLSMGPGGIQSGINVQQPNEPVFWYTRELANLIDQTSDKQDILMLGGGTFTLPQQVALKYPRSHIDVVEIDPKLADIARQHFFYRDPHNVNLIFDDARIYSNQTSKRYDVIVVDVYGNTDIPFTFMTEEYGRAIKKILRPGGVVMVNLIAGERGGCQELLAALEAPYRQNFQQRLIKPNGTEATAALPHNIIAVYSDQKISYSRYTDLAIPRVPAFTDDFTPAEHMRQKCLA